MSKILKTEVEAKAVAALQEEILKELQIEDPKEEDAKAAIKANEEESA